jgi:CheY-like chemotaxis protein
LDIVGQGVDLVVSSLNSSNESRLELISEIKQIQPDVPTVLLTGNPTYHGPLAQAPSVEPFDFVFAWRGKTDLVPAIVMMVEDRLNADHDVLVGGVQVILLIEDEPGLYSRYLPMLYKEVLLRVRDLTPVDAEPSEVERRIQARTKVMLARNYEEAVQILARYGDSLCGLLTDLEYARAGVQDPEAGLALTRYVKQQVRPSIPVIVQSRNCEVEEPANDAGAFFIWKNSDRLLFQLREIMLDYFGFGDFVFRTPLGEEVARARDLGELAHCLEQVSLTVFQYHGARDHFSTWLFIHGEHELARQMRAIRETNEHERAEALQLILYRLGRCPQ